MHKAIWYQHSQFSITFREQQIAK